MASCAVFEAKGPGFKSRDKGEIFFFFLFLFKLLFHWDGMLVVVVVEEKRISSLSSPSPFLHFSPQKTHKIPRKRLLCRLSSTKYIPSHNQVAWPPIPTPWVMESHHTLKILLLCSARGIDNYFHIYSVAQLVTCSKGHRSSLICFHLQFTALSVLKIDM